MNPEKRDFTNEVKNAINMSIELSQNSGIDAAMEHIMEAEKDCRNSGDVQNLKEIVLHAVRLCRSMKNWLKLNQTLQTIAKRRAQLKQAVIAIVAEATSYVPSTPSAEVKIDLIKALIDISDGKLYLEAEHARLCLSLAKLYDDDMHDPATACTVLQDIHVETYGSLTKKEKANFILEQLRLQLMTSDLIRALITSRKLTSVKWLDTDADLVDERISLCKLMILYHHTVAKINHSPLDTDALYHHYMKMYTNRPLLSDLHLAVLFLLSSFFNGADYAANLLKCLKILDYDDYVYLTRASSLVHDDDDGNRRRRDNNDDYDDVVRVLRLYNRNEIITQDQITGFIARGEELLMDTGHVAEWKILTRKRLVQHNLRIVSKYYSQIRISRLCELLQLSLVEVEDEICDLVSFSNFYCRIDRPIGICSFRKKNQGANAVLTEWTGQIGSLVKLLDRTCHLVNREIMTHKLE